MKKLLCLLALACSSAFSAPVITGMSPNNGPTNTFITLTGTGFTGTTAVTLGMATDGLFVIINDTTIYYTVPWDAPPGTANLTVSPGTATTASVPFTVTPAPTFAIDTPRCMIDQFFGNFHSATSAGGTTVYLLWCDDQAGLEYWGVGGATTGASLSSIPAACKTVLAHPQWSLAWIQAAWPVCMLGPLSTDTQATMNQLAHQWVPRLTVSAGTNQNVYTQKADGTKGPQLVVNGVGEQIAPGASCDGLRLLNAGGRYAMVDGRTSTDGVVLPKGSFALCDIQYPPAGGFTN